MTSTARSLVQLKRMNVKDCKTMQEIVAIASDEVEYDSCLSQLQYLGLEYSNSQIVAIASGEVKLIDEEAKSLFLLCSLFGSLNIRIHNLLVYYMGLGSFKHMNSTEGSRNRVLTLIDKLKNESLLLDGDKAGFVKIHDVVRDISTAIASRVHYAFVGKGQIRSTDMKSKDCKRISLPFCEIPKLPEVFQCPEAEVFSVFAEDLSLHIPASFFEGARKLKVLHFTGVSFMFGLPSSISFLTALQTLSLDVCKLNNVAIIAQLKQLEVLSFAGSNIAVLPREIEALTQLKLLDLTGCNHLAVIPSNVLSNPCVLEELYVLNRYDGWGTEGNASLVELKNLSLLKTLKIEVKDDKLLPEDWFFNGIQNYKIIICYWYWSSALDTSRMLKLELKTRIGLMHRMKEFMGGAEVLYLHEVNGIKIISFQRLRFLSIEKCNSLREVIPFSSEKCLPHLQEMEVRSCCNIEAIVGEGNEVEVMEFPRLTSLELRLLPHVRDICRTSGMVSFPNLTSLEIYKCNSLKYVFTTSMVKSLKQLRKLDISCCNSMEEIILVTKFEEVAEGNIDKIVFHEFDFLQLCGLRTLKRFSSGYPIEFPKLRELMITTCCEMKNFVSKYSDRSNNNESSDEYLFNKLVIANIEVLTLDHHSLKAIQSDEHGFPSELLWKLKRFTLYGLVEEFVPILFDFLRRIYSVEKLNFYKGYVGEIFSLHDERATGDQQQQYNFGLKHLNLDSVSKLKHIVKEDSQLNPIFQRFHILSVSGCKDMVNIAPSSSVSFNNLITLHVFRCEKMTSLVTASTAKSMIELTKLEVRECRAMEEIIAKDRDCTEGQGDVITFSKLKFLALYGLRSLKSFCSDNYMFNFPLLDQVYIQRCNQMKTFCGEVVITPKLPGEGNVNAIIARQIQEHSSEDEEDFSKC